MLNKSYLDEDEMKKLDEVFNLYIKHGIDYNKKMDDLYMSELEGMVRQEYTESKTNEIEMQNIIISQENEIDNQIII